MNKRQWFTLFAGTVPVAALVVFGAAPQQQSMMGPVIETSPSRYSAELTTVHVLPKWTTAAMLGAVVLTGTFVYRSRNTAQ